jgi:hypothetical protein
MWNHIIDKHPEHKGKADVMLWGRGQNEEDNDET